MGRRIVEVEQGGKGKPGYGEELIVSLSRDLTARFGRGYGKSRLYQMRAFYEVYSQILQTACGESGEPGDNRIFQTLCGKSEEEPARGIAQTVSAQSGQTCIGEILQTPSAKPEEAALGNISETVSRKSEIAPVGRPPTKLSTLAAIAQRFPLPWSHYVRLLSVADAEGRRFYEAEALRCG